jgi:hypothetical protein
LEVTSSVEPFDGQGQAGQQPYYPQAVPFMVADMFEAVTVPGIVESLILDFPASLRQAENRAAADLGARKIGEPV